MNNELQFAYKVRQLLNHSAENLDKPTALRLHEARQKALAHQRRPLSVLSLAGVGHLISDNFLSNARILVALVALTAGVFGTYQWNSNQIAAENAELDTALLSDELPINAYLDRGFHTWLAHQPQSQSSQ